MFMISTDRIKHSKRYFLPKFEGKLLDRVRCVVDEIGGKDL